jgi:Protein of unknown function (DUF4013)
MESDTIAGLDPNAAFKKIFKDPSWKLVLGIGSTVNAATLVLLTSGKFALPLLPVAFLVWAASQGYMLKVARTVIKSPGDGLPSWSGWADMMISGLTWLAITCAQIIVFFSVLYFSLIFGSMRQWLQATTPQFTYWAYGTIFAEILVLFLGAFFFPLLMANFAEKERASAALAVKSALDRLYRSPEQFILLWLLSSGIYAIAVVVPLLTVVGVFFIPLTTFVASLANTIMLGQVWRAASSTNDGSN